MHDPFLSDFRPTPIPCATYYVHTNTSVMLQKQAFKTFLFRMSQNYINWINLINFALKNAI